MATEGVMLRDGSGTTATTDLSAKQYFAVKLDTAGDRNVVLASTGGERIYGILQNKPTAGLAADVCLTGLSKAQIGGTITRGDVLKTDTAGKLITASTGNIGVAEAMESGVAGDVRAVHVFGGPISAP